MIEPTDEMIEAFYLAGQDGPDVRGGLAAVLALVERDYRITCGNVSPVDGPNYCVKEPGHAGGHIGLSPSAARVW